MSESISVETSIDDVNTTTTTTTTSKPEYVPDKFFNAETGAIDYEGLAKSYVELEKKFSAGNNTTQASTNTTQASTNTTQASTTLSIPTQEAETVSDVDTTPIIDKYIKGESLTKADKETLGKAGIGEKHIDTYLAGQKALAESYANSLMSVVGGADEYSKMVKWASSNLDPASIKAYDLAIKNKELAKFAVESLFAKYKSGVGIEPKLVQGGASSTGVTGYSSPEEMAKDMNHPDYQISPAYREKVKARLAATTAF